MKTAPTPAPLLACSDENCAVYFFRASDASLLGFRPDTDGCLTNGSHDYPEEVTGFRVLSSAIDGARKPRVFSTAEKALAYVAAEGWLADGGVSDDGVTRFDGVQIRIGGHWSRLRVSLSAVIAAMDPTPSRAPTEEDERDAYDAAAWEAENPRQYYQCGMEESFEESCNRYFFETIGGAVRHPSEF